MEPFSVALIGAIALGYYLLMGEGSKEKTPPKGSSAPAKPSGACNMYIAEYLKSGSPYQPDDGPVKVILIEEGRRLMAGLPSLGVAYPSSLGLVTGAAFKSDSFAACFGPSGSAKRDCVRDKAEFSAIEINEIAAYANPMSGMYDGAYGDFANLAEEILFGRMESVALRDSNAFSPTVERWLYALANCAPKSGIMPPETFANPLEAEIDSILRDDNAEPDDLRALAASLGDAYPDIANMLLERADMLEATIRAKATSDGGWSYSVRANDTPYGISLAYGEGDPRPIKNMNGLSAKTTNGITLYTPFNPGQRILLPLSWSRPRKTDPAHPGPGLTSPCEAIASQRYADTFKATVGAINAQAGNGGKGNLSPDLAATAAALAAATMARLECEGVGYHEPASTYYPNGGD